MKKIFYISALLLFTSNLFAQIPVKGLVAWYPFSGDANNYVNDNNNGVVNGAILTTDRFDNPNSAFSFDGINDNILIHTDSLLAPYGKTNYSVSMWCKYQGDGYLMQIFTGTNGQNISNYDFTVGSSKLGFINYPFYKTSTSSIDTINHNTWTHFILQYNQIKDTVTVYKNILLSFKAPLSTTPPKAGLISIGAVINNLAPFKGSIDDIRFYNRALTTSEMSALYNENQCLSFITVTDTLKISAVSGINTLPDNFGLLKVFPNPAKDVLNISASNPTANYSFQITNNIGTVVYSGNLSSSNTQLNISTLGNKGLYFIKILDVTNNVLDSRKLIFE